MSEKYYEYTFTLKSVTTDPELSFEDALGDYLYGNENHPACSFMRHEHKEITKSEVEAFCKEQGADADEVFSFDIQ